MPPMLRELSKDKTLGCLSFEMLFKYRGVMIVQYWESMKNYFLIQNAGTFKSMAIYERT